MARPREYDDDLRVRLVETAARLLATEGPAAMTTRRVAAEVGTSTTAIYSLIGSKDDLLAAICREGFQRLADHLGAVTRTDDPVADLGHLALAYHDMGVESPHLYGVMFDHGQLDNASPEDVEFSLSTLQTLIDAVQRAIDAGAFAGAAEDLALQLWGLNHGITSLAIAGMMGTPAEARTRVHESGRLMAEALRARAAAPAPPHRAANRSKTKAKVSASRGR